MGSNAMEKPMADDQDIILLADRYEIKSSERLANLDSPGALAYAVVDRDDPAGKLFALIPPPHLRCRAFLYAIDQVKQSNMLWPRRVGIVDWPISGSGEETIWGRRPALIFPRPGGERVMANGKAQVPLFTESQILKQVLEPILQALARIGPSKATHRAIRPDNLSYQRATGRVAVAGVQPVHKPSVGHSMAYPWNDAIGLVEQPEFDLWLRRSFNDEKAADMLLRIRSVAQNYGPPSGMRGRLVGRLIAHLIQPGPICFKDIRVSLTGIGTLLADVIDNRELVNQFAEMMRAKIHQAWIQEQAGIRPEQISAMRPLEDTEAFIERAGAGYGIERALYELEPRTPCRSQLIADFYVTDLKDLLPALDAAMPGLDAGTKPMDRHIAAFIAAHF